MRDITGVDKAVTKIAVRWRRVGSGVALILDPARLHAVDVIPRFRLRECQLVRSDAHHGSILAVKVQDSQG